MKYIPNMSRVTGDFGTKVVLTAPLGLENKELESEYKTPTVLQRILSLLSNVRLGSDLTRFQLPPQFNIPKSQLQCYGEAVYSIGTDMLGRCTGEETSIDRFVAVVAWSVSTIRPLGFGVAPYNPILGETHHVSKGTLNVLLEQVSHHPPVTALHATDDTRNIEILWSQSPVPKFYGTHVNTEVHGERQLKLLDRNETYKMNSPSLVIRFLPVPRVDWLGNVSIRCEKTGLEAELCYLRSSFLSWKSVHRSLKGKIFVSATSETVYEISGHWDRIVMAKNVSTGATRVIYNAKEALSGLKHLTVTDPKAVSKSESAVIWGKVNEAIMQRSWDKAREAKTWIEEKQRELTQARKSRKENWVPKHFMASQSKERGWECIPNKKLVPPAPIVVDGHQ